MKKYTLKELVIEVTGFKEDDYNWDSEYDFIRRVQALLKTLFGAESITDINKDKYVRVYKLIYNNQDIKPVISKCCKILKEVKVKGNKIDISYFQKDLTKEEYIIVLKVLLEFYKGEEVHYLINGMINEMIAEQYNEILNEFELEVEKIKISIQGYPYEEKLQKMNEIKEYLKNQRLEIDKNVNDNLILPY